MISGCSLGRVIVGEPTSDNSDESLPCLYTVHLMNRIVN